VKSELSPYRSRRVLNDISALVRASLRRAGADFDEELDLVADPDDPLDLYGMLMRTA
jgi:ornithine cyclodeaminase